MRAATLTVRASDLFTAGPLQLSTDYGSVLLARDGTTTPLPTVPLRAWTIPSAEIAPLLASGPDGAASGAVLMLDTS